MGNDQYNSYGGLFNSISMMYAPTSSGAEDSRASTRILQFKEDGIFETFLLDYEMKKNLSVDSKLHSEFKQLKCDN